MSFALAEPHQRRLTLNFQLHMMQPLTPTDYFLIELGLKLTSVLPAGAISWSCWKLAFGCAPSVLARLVPHTGGEELYDLLDIEAYLLSLLALHVLFWGVRLLLKKWNPKGLL